MKLSIKNIILQAGLMGLFAAGTVQAQWILVDDFESYEEGTYNNDNGNLIYPVASNGGPGQIDIFTGIEGTGGEKAAWIWYGRADTAFSDVWHQIALPQEVAVQQQATLYFRVWQSAFELNWHVMVSKVAAGDEPDNTALWGNQAAIMRYNSDEPIDVDAHSGGYVPSNPRHAPETGLWYEYWMVLDNSYDANDEQVEVGGYQIYLRKPGEAQAVMTWGGDTTFDRLVFRNKAKTSLKTLVIIQNSGHAGNVWLIDDIHMSPGVNLTTPGDDPVDPAWCGITKVGGDVNTGDFLGWIWVGDATGAGWVYSYSLDGFVYVSSCPDAAGAWVYVLN